MPSAQAGRATGQRPRKTQPLGLLMGVVCTFVTSDDHGWVRATERMIGATIPRRQFAGFQTDAVDTPPLRVSQQPSRGSTSRNQGRSRRRYG